MRNYGFKFEPRDLWVGLFIDREKYPRDGGRSRKYYLVLFPTLVFWWRRVKS
jgi:hypothetical protein